MLPLELLIYIWRIINIILHTMHLQLTLFYFNKYNFYLRYYQLQIALHIAKYIMLLNNYYFCLYLIKKQAMDNPTLQSLLEFQNPLIRLYVIKKNLQEELIRKIHINSFLHNAASKQPPIQCKVQHIRNSDHNETSTNSKFVTHSARLRKKSNIGKKKNDTKNIPKNFGKAIITFAQQNQHIVRRLLAQQNVQFEDFFKALKSKKKEINSIAELRNLWLEENFVYAKQTRIFSLYFLKRNSLNYVFSSRISNLHGHIKYRNRLIEVLRAPHNFTSIKTE